MPCVLGWRMGARCVARTFGGYICGGSASVSAVAGGGMFENSALLDCVAGCVDRVDSAAAGCADAVACSVAFIFGLTSAAGSAGGGTGGAVGCSVATVLGLTSVAESAEGSEKGDADPWPGIACGRASERSSGRCSCSSNGSGLGKGKPLVISSDPSFRSRRSWLNGLV